MIGPANTHATPPLIRSGTLRRRLLLGTLAWIVLTIVVAGWGLTGLFRQHVALQFHAELRTHLDQLAAHLIIDPDGQPQLSIPQSDPRFSKPYSGLYWQIDRIAPRADGTLGLLRSRSLWDNVLRLPADTPSDGEVHQHRIAGPDRMMLGLVERAVTVDDAAHPDRPAYRLVVAANEQQMAEPIEDFNNILWLSLGLLGGGLALAAVIQVLIALGPLKRLSHALTNVRSGGTARLEGRFPGEVAPLVKEFNTVLEANEEIVKRARTQAGNLAHALKTPLSVMANAATSRNDDLAKLVTSQIGIARRQIDYHLSQSRVAASARLPGMRTPLLPVVEGLVRVMQRIHAERRLEIVVRTESIGDTAFQGEEQDLQEMLGNVLDNACKWAKHRIEVSLDAGDGELRLAIDDDGGGIVEEERKRVVSRGERADENVPGSGLGLAIVEELTRLYGGRIQLLDSLLGGAKVVLILPRAEAK